MQISVKAVDLARAVEAAKQACSSRTIDILRHVLLGAQGEELEVSATDTDTTIRLRCPATVKAPGSIALDPGRLLEIAKSSSGDVRIETSDDLWATVASGNARFRLPGLPETDWPLRAECVGAGIAIPGQDLVRLIKCVRFAMPAGDALSETRACLLEVAADALLMVAADRHRLAYARRAGEYAATKPVETLIHGPAIQILEKLLATGDTVTLYNESEHQVGFVGPKWTIFARRPSGSLPPFRTYLKRLEKGAEVSFDRAALASLIRRVGIVAAAKTEGIGLRLSSGELRAHATSHDAGNSEDWLQADYSGHEIELGVNARYVQEFLAVDGSPSVVLSMPLKGYDGGLPIVMSPRGGDAALEHIYMISPMRL